MCLSYLIKLREDRLQPMATGFHSVFKYFDYEATATAAGGRTEQPQPAVRLQSVALGPVPVFFPVHETGLLNTNSLCLASETNEDKKLNANLMNSLRENARKRR